MDNLKNIMINTFKRYWGYLIGALIGGVAGYLQWLYIGCETGTCPLTATPTRTVIYGAILGALLLSLFSERKKKEQ